MTVDQNQKTIQITHPDWCLSDDCKPRPDGSVIHIHLQAVVAGARILVEQVDIPDADGALKSGTPKVVTEFPMGAHLSNKDMRRVIHFQSRVALLTGESTKTGGSL